MNFRIDRDATEICCRHRASSVALPCTVAGEATVHARCCCRSWMCKRCFRRVEQIQLHRMSAIPAVNTRSEDAPAGTVIDTVTVMPEPEDDHGPLGQCRGRRRAGSDARDHLCGSAVVAGSSTGRNGPYWCPRRLCHIRHVEDRLGVVAQVTGCRSQCPPGSSPGTRTWDQCRRPGRVVPSAVSHGW